MPWEHLVNLDELRNTDLLGALYALAVGVTFALKSEAKSVENVGVRTMRWIEFAAVVNAIFAVLMLIWLSTALVLRWLVFFQGG